MFAQSVVTMTARKLFLQLNNRLLNGQAHGLLIFNAVWLADSFELYQKFKHLVADNIFLAFYAEN